MTTRGFIKVWIISALLYSLVTCGVVATWHACLPLVERQELAFFLRQGAKACLWSFYSVSEVLEWPLVLWRDYVDVTSQFLLASILFTQVVLWGALIAVTYCALTSRYKNGPAASGRPLS